jgi:hypothetical protein
MFMRLLCISFLFLTASCFGYWTQQEPGVGGAGLSGAVRTRWPLAMVSTEAGSVFYFGLAHRLHATADLARSEIYVPQLETYFLQISATEFLWRTPYAITGIIRRPNLDRKNWIWFGRSITEISSSTYTIKDTDGLVYTYEKGELVRLQTERDELTVSARAGRIEEIRLARTGEVLVSIVYDEIQCLPRLILLPEQTITIAAEQGRITSVSKANCILFEFFYNGRLLRQVEGDVLPQIFRWQRNPYQALGYPVLDVPLLLRADGEGEYQWLVRGDFIRISANLRNGRAEVLEFLGRTQQLILKSRD